MFGENAECVDGIEMDCNTCCQEDMSGENAEDKDNRIEMNCSACRHEFCDCYDDDDEFNVDSDSDSDSINNSYIDYEEKGASRTLAFVTCVEDILPTDGLTLRLLHKSSPLFESARFDALPAECLNIYDGSKVKVKRILRNLDGQISLSVDVLRCPSAGEYLCLKAHFIDSDWIFQNWVICFRPLTRLTGDDFLPGAIQKCIIDMDIAHKICSITLDNCSHNDEGIDTIKVFLQQKRKLLFNGELFRLYCCADVFVSMVNDALKSISDIMHKVDEYLNFGKPIYTWNNAYTNLKEALEYEAKGEWDKKEYENYDKCSADEWNKVESLCKLLESLYGAAKSVFEAKRPTANMYLHNLYVVRGSLSEASIRSNNFVRLIAKRMLEKLDKYLKNMFLVLAIAEVMDPQCKIKYMDSYLTKHGGNYGISDLSALLTVIQNLYDDYVAQSRNPVTDSTSSNTENSSMESCDDNSDLLQKPVQIVEEPDNKHLKSELELYLEDDILSWSQDFDILSWWKSASPKYPVLARMARDFLAIPVSAVTSLDAYYTVEREISSRVASLQPNLMNAVMCTRSWGAPEAKSIVRSLFGGDLIDFMEDAELAEDIASCFR